MANDVGIDVPESYGGKNKKTTSVPPQKTIKEIPNSINKVKKRIVRGVLKEHGSSSN
jgi:hypothetical protein